MVWSQGTAEEREYRGSWVRDKAQGFGTLSSGPKGWLFRGNFLNNKKVKGVLIKMQFNVTRYIGYLHDDKPEGLGILYGTNKDHYAGYFKAGVPNGVGALETSTKESYGEIKSWREHGHCTIYDKEKNSQFVGQFEQGF